MTSIHASTDSDRPYVDGRPRRRLALVRSPHSEIVVDGTDEARYLWFGWARQAGVRLGPDGFDFRMALARGHRSFDLADLYQPEVGSVLHLGLGAGNAAMRTTLRHPAAAVEAVELDAEVVAVATAWFGFDAARCPVHVEDAFTFLERDRRTWDRIVFDAFLSEGGRSELNALPPHLGGAAFVSLLEARLRPRGLLLANLPGAVRGPEAAPLLALLERFERALGTVVVHSVADRTGGGETVDDEHPSLAEPDEFYVVCARREPFPDRAETVAAAQSAHGQPFVDDEIVVFARNRVELAAPAERR